MAALCAPTAAISAWLACQSDLPMDTRVSGRLTVFPIRLSPRAGAATPMTKYLLMCSALAALAGACGESKPASSALPPDAVTLASTDVARLGLLPLRSVSLGHDATDTPEHLSDVQIDSRGVYVLD